MPIPLPLTVFLSISSSHPASLRDEMKNTLIRAGINVVPVADSISGQGNFSEEVTKALALAHCSVHILEKDFGPTLETDLSVSLAKYQFQQAKKKLSSDPDFKMFIWYPPEVLAAQKDILQEQFINEIRNSIERHMVFTNSGSSIQLADDIRNMMAKEEKTKFDIKDAEVFLVFNQLDEAQAAEVVDMLSDIVDVSKLNIVQDSDMDYSEFCTQQLGKSKLAVVYFKETSDWALPFTQQVWKKAGGASLKTPILLIGDENPETNMSKKFNAPKVISLIVSGDLIPLEIKVQYDKVMEGLNI